MKTIAIAMAKGGVGKTTISAALSVQAAKEFKRVGMIDFNRDQASLTQWYGLRGEPDNPKLLTVSESDEEDLHDAIAGYQKAGWHVCFIDTPPGRIGALKSAIDVADAVLIPVKTSIFDAGSLQPVIELCETRRTPFALVLSDVDARFKNANNEVAEALASAAPLCDVRISHLQSYMVAPNLGKTGAEIDKKAADEIEALWKAVWKLASQRKGGGRG